MARHLSRQRLDGFGRVVGQAESEAFVEAAGVDHVVLEDVRVGPVGTGEANTALQQWFADQQAQG
ncbi:hypothetical protein [Streptomyces sp. NPDC050856]|uniref:hypothetical protein n=1 Tax=Streptomyces sp. NPDC050856 TaxID=3154939 RepID=UPI0033F6E152